MGAEKSELKMAVAHELGAGFDDALEKAEDDAQKWIGAKTALADAAKSIEALLAHVSQDVDEEAITIEAGNAAQKYIKRAAEVCLNLKLKAEVHEQRSYGRVEALKTVIKVTKTLHDREGSKVEALKAHEEREALKESEGLLSEGVERRPPARPSGARPSNLIGALKKSEKGE